MKVEVFLKLIGIVCNVYKFTSSKSTRKLIRRHHSFIEACQHFSNGSVANVVGIASMVTLLYRIIRGYGIIGGGWKIFQNFIIGGLE